MRDYAGVVARGRRHDAAVSAHAVAGGRPVLVTGMHRSGTTWLGEMLASSHRFMVFDEPLNVRNRQTVLRSRVDRWYTYVNEANENHYLSDYRDAVALRPHPLRDLRMAWRGSPQNLIRIPGRWWGYARSRREQRRVMFKDPFAIFSLDWFRRQLGCLVVVSIRHPLAVVSSLKRLGYTFDFKDLLSQDALMVDRLEPYRREIKALLSSPSDAVDEGSLLWRIIYETVAGALSADDRSLLVVRHEDLSLRPIEEFAALYDALDVPFTDEARRTIERSTSASNPSESALAEPGSLRLDSRANLHNWRHRLSDDEIDRIMTRTQPALDRFYPGGLAAATAWP